MSPDHSSVMTPFGPHPALRATFSRREKGVTFNQTFNNRNSRSHELITRKKVSYSLRLTDT